ncbi:nuclease-related domain-containing protein [Marinobacter changyiensis]|uniref:nuclease-related domain-containing protein n=1 Tax=Marinobacter changyiensis TaxID=2604091 RepID=UPI001264C419|nr:nuclease-related domain-containing protein [Marinobacter changyiensis]
MDPSVLLQPLLHFWYFIPLLLLLAVLRSPWFKGHLGEFIVNVSARLFLDKDRYHLIKNVTLPTEDGTTQIDHIIVSRYGVFVVETKNMKGWIFGNAQQRQWTQKIFRHNQKFQNPLHQNYKHVKTLQALLGLTESQIHSLVVFLGDATFKTEMPPNVTKGRGYLRFIESHLNTVLTPEQVSEVIERIAARRLTASFKTHRAHVRHVQEIVAGKTQQMDFGGATDRDRLIHRNEPRRKGGGLKPKLAIIAVMVVFVYLGGPGELTRLVAGSVAQSVQANVTARPEVEAPKIQPNLEAERARQAEDQRQRLAEARQAKERAFERAFNENYVAPEGCDNWKSDRHMVECVNYGMRAKAAFHESYFGAGSAGAEG